MPAATPGVRRSAMAGAANLGTPSSRLQTMAEHACCHSPAPINHVTAGVLSDLATRLIMLISTCSYAVSYQPGEPGKEAILSTKHLHVTSMTSKKPFSARQGLAPRPFDNAIGVSTHVQRIPDHWCVHDVFKLSSLKPWHDNGINLFETYAYETFSF